jgi:hypothetical protein
MCPALDKFRQCIEGKPECKAFLEAVSLYIDTYKQMHARREKEKKRETDGREGNSCLFRIF